MPVEPQSVPPLTLDTATIGLSGDFTWLVPSIAVSVPGVALVAVGGLQATSGLLWVPMVKRRLGVRSRTRRPTRLPA